MSFRRFATCIMAKGLFSAQLEGLSVLIPSPGVVSAFNSLVTPFDSIIEVLIDEINNLQKQRDDLLPQFIIGKLTC